MKTTVISDTVTMGKTVAASVSAMQQEWKDTVRDLAKKNNAVILAHNYQPALIQDIADHVGDSLALSTIAASVDAEMIIFCGVHFMAETAKILNPDKKVLIPDSRAGCSLADSITVAELIAWKQEYPDAVVVSYVNTTAEIKSYTDICCTSSNALDVINSIDPHREILFLPDQFLGAHVKRMSGRDNIHIWSGECHVHASINGAQLAETIRNYPEADVYIHPECGCATPALYLSSQGVVPEDRLHILSTGQMLSAAQKSSASQVLIATEVGMLHQLRSAAKEIDFIPVNSEASCKYMKMITPDALLSCLLTGNDEVLVNLQIADRARASVERMIAIGNSTQVCK